MNATKQLPMSRTDMSNASVPSALPAYLLLDRSGQATTNQEATTRKLSLTVSCAHGKCFREAVLGMQAFGRTWVSNTSIAT